MFPLTPKCVATLITRCHLSVSAAGLANTCKSSASSCVRQTLFDLENIPRRYILASWRCCYRLSGHICGAIVSHLSLNEQVLCWGLYHKHKASRPLHRYAHARTHSRAILCSVHAGRSDNLFAAALSIIEKETDGEGGREPVGLSSSNGLASHQSLLQRQWIDERRASLTVRFQGKGQWAYNAVKSALCL